MDPLSIVGSSIAVAGTASVGLKLIYRIYKAKPEVLALINELTDVTAILLEVERYIQPGQPVDDTNNNLVETVSEIKRKFEELVETVSKWHAASGSVDGLHLRWLRIAFKVKTFRDDFKAVRSKLKLLLPALTIQHSSRIELDLKQIMLFARETSASQDTFHGQFQNELAEQRNYLEMMSEKLEARSDGQSVVDHSNDNENIGGDLPGATGQQARVESTDEQIVRAFHHNGSILFDSSQMTAISAVGIRTAQFPRSVCRPWCSCACHTECRFRSPQLLDQVIGSLFVGYSGLPGLRRKCNQHSCHLKSQPMTYITYYFPQWFLARTISFVLSTTPLAGPVASLKVSRTVSGNSAIFTYAKTGDVGKIKSLFEGGLASPHDVHFGSGVTALHLAISHRQYLVCKFLLQANADPFMEDRTAWTAADNAWTKILSNSLDPSSEQTLRSMFSATECLERREFTILHKIILGFVSLDLETELLASTAEINTQDTNGRTPLSIAAERGDANSVSTLLRYGADPNLASSCQASPLHYAASSPDPVCIPLLLTHGGHVDSMTGWNQTPLHYVAAYTTDARHAELLLAAGANPQAIDLDGIDPIGWTAITGNTPVAEVLLKRGVNVLNRDESGDSALIQCLRGHHNGLLALLIRYGVLAELGLSGRERSWAEIAAAADVASLRLLKEGGADGGGFPVPEVEKLFEIVRTRADACDDLISAFRALFDNHAWTVDGDNDAVEIWEDAVETI